MRVPPECSLELAACIMRQAGISSVLVGDGDGIATEHEVTIALRNGLRPEDPIAAVLSTTSCVAASVAASGLTPARFG
jgi:hypothetical protein